MSEPTPASILEDAREQLWMAIDPVKHTNAVMVENALEVLRVALVKQRRLIARSQRAEAAAFRRGVMPSGNHRLTYDGGLRRAARIAEAIDDA